MTVTVKLCLRCGETKPLAEFHLDVNRADGFFPWCAACKNASNMATWNAKTQQKRTATSRERQMWHRYRIRPNEYDAILADQDGRCAICGTQKPAGRYWLDVDHDHETGEIRGLLCGPCNKGLGQYHDNPDLLRAAADYLENHEPADLGRLPFPEEG